MTVGFPEVVNFLVNVEAVMPPHSKMEDLRMPERQISRTSQDPQTAESQQQSLKPFLGTILCFCHSKFMLFQQQKGVFVSGLPDSQLPGDGQVRGILIRSVASHSFLGLTALPRWTSGTPISRKKSRWTWSPRRAGHASRLS